jgi:hypothetical protein
VKARRIHDHDGTSERNFQTSLLIRRFHRVRQAVPTDNTVECSMVCYCLPAIYIQIQEKKGLPQGSMGHQSTLDKHAGCISTCTTRRASRDKLSSPYKYADCALNVHSLLLLLSDSKMDFKESPSLCSHLDLRLASPNADACSCRSRTFTVRSGPWICLPSSCSQTEPPRPLECLNCPRRLQQ